MGSQPIVDRRRRITLPSLDVRFAYFLGILLGDGSVGDNSHSMIYLVCHLTDERDFYDRVVIPLMSSLFGIQPYSYVRKGQQAYATHFSSTRVVAYLKSEIGFPTQNSPKLVPQKVRDSRPEIRSAFIAGLFDSDGTLVLSKKTYRSYEYPTIEIKSVCRHLVDEIAQMLDELDFRARLRRSAESWVTGVNGVVQLEKWMGTIASHNIKHLSKYLVWKRNHSCSPKTSTESRLELLGLGIDGFYRVLKEETGIDALEF